MPLTPGTRLGPYEILSPIGTGGMGEVYRARDSRLDRTVAVKLIPQRLECQAIFGELQDRTGIAWVFNHQADLLR